MSAAVATPAEARFEALPALVNADAGLVRRGRYLTTTFLVEVGSTAYLVHVVEGRLVRLPSCRG